MIGRLALASLLAVAFLLHSLAAALPTSHPSGQALPDRIPGSSPTGLSDEDLQELVAPIAIYPDSLLAIMLEASLFPDDVRAAAAFVRGGGTAEQAAQKEWDEAVIALAAVPDALNLLHDYSEWADALGTAFLTQSEALMSAVQEMRRRAWDNGSLFTTPQQIVVREEQTIIITPANPQVIYVPVFNPRVVYAPVVVVRPRPDPVAVAAIAFGVGVVVGGVIWANSGCNWRISGCWGSRCWNRFPQNNNNNNNSNNTNINININNPRPPSAGWPRPGGDRETWRPAPDRPGQGRDFLNRPNSSVDRWRGVGEGTATSAPRIPGREGSTPIARPNIPSAGGSRPSLPANRPAIQTPPAGGVNRPSLPAGSNLNRPSGSGGAFDQNRNFPSGGTRVGQGNAAGGNRGGNVTSGNNRSRPAVRPAPAPPSRPVGGGRIGGVGSGGGSFGGGRLGGRR